MKVSMSGCYRIFLTLIIIFLILGTLGLLFILNHDVSFSLLDSKSE